MKQQIENIKNQIVENENVLEQLHSQKKELDSKFRILFEKTNELKKQLKILEAQQIDNNIAVIFFEKHPEFYYIGKSNGKIKEYEHIYASCNKCYEDFRLFGCETGIGEVIIGICPKCEAEVNFSNYRNW